MVTQTKEHIRRTIPLRVKLSPEIASRLDSIAHPRGLTAATLGAVAVGEFVERYQRALNREYAGNSEQIVSSPASRIGGIEGSSAGAEAAADGAPAA